MATYLIVFSISLFILSYSFVECNKRTLSYTNTTYTHNENVNFTSIISDDGSMNFYLTTFKDLENFVIDLNVFVKNENSVTFREKINNTLDICRLLENAGSNMYIGRILEPLLKNKENKIIRKCPIEKVRFGLYLIFFRNFEEMMKLYYLLIFSPRRATIT